MGANESGDRLSKELRAAEREIDSQHSSNPLMTRPFAEAGWHYLAFCEELVMKEAYWTLRGATRSEPHQVAFADALIFQPKWPLRWLRKQCPVGGVIPHGFDDAMYAAARGLSELSRRYLSFEAAFTWASLGMLSLTLDDRTIRATGPLRSDLRFEAYDRLVKPVAFPALAAKAFLDAVASSVRVNEERFTYTMNRSVMTAGLDALGPLIDARFLLAGDWNLPRFSLAQFRRVARVLIAWSTIHFYARVAAAMSGCRGLGIAQALVLVERKHLVRRLHRYGGVPEAAVSAIVDDLTYGGRKQENPDPALQPLVPLTESTYAITPNLVINSSMERNLAVLLNRLPEERSAYAALSHAREDQSRESVVADLSGLPLRFWHGHVPGWQGGLEVDLAIISDVEKECLLLELKSFIAPAEPREIHDRSKEIAKGIDQVRSRMKAAEEAPTPLRTSLGIGDGYSLGWAVASESSIGAAYVQAPDVPVVNLRHLIARLRSHPLAECRAWLAAREYLPAEGVHYRVVEITTSVGNWNLEWWGIDPLVDALP